MEQPSGKQPAPSTSQDAPPGGNAAVPPKQAYKMNQVGPAQQQVVPQTIMSADGQYQILALPTFQMGNGDWQNHVLSLAQAQTILSIPGLGPVQAVDPATLAAAEAAAAAAAAGKPRKRNKTGRPKGQGPSGAPGANPQVTQPTYAAMPTGSGGAGGEVDGEDEYEDVSSDEQNAYDVLRTWQQAREVSGSKEGGGDGGPADADSGAPVAGDFPRRKRTRREREGARGAAAGSRLAAALNAQQLQQQQQLVLAQAQAQAGLAAGLPAGLLPMHLAAGNLSDLLVNYVGGPTSMAAAGPEDPAMRPPEMMVPAAAPLNTELPVESHDMHNPDLRQALQAEAEAAAIAAHASLAAHQNAAQQQQQEQQEQEQQQQQQAGPVSDALMMAPAEEVAALSGALQQEQQAGGEGQEGGGMQEGQAAQQQHEEEQQQAAAAAAAAQAAAAAAAIERKPRVYHSGRSRRLHDSKVHWPEGKKLLDGRILIPHSFILEHFGPEATFPQTPGGEVVINGEVQPRDTLKLRLYSTSNNVKSTGQGNFWLTGVQPLIKMHQDVKVISVEMTPARELRIVLTSQGLWHNMGVKGQRKGRIRSGENGPVQMYDGRIHLPLSLVNQHLQGVTFPYHLTGIYHITRGSQTIVHEVGARVVQYRKHKNDNKYNYWLTGHQSVLKLYNDLRVQQVDWEREGVVRVQLIGPPPPGENHQMQMVAPEIAAAAASVANGAGASQLPPLAPLNALSFGGGLPAASLIQLGAGGPYVPLFTNLGAGQQLLTTGGLEGLGFAVDGVQQVQLSAEQLASLQQMMQLQGMGLELVQHTLPPEMAEQQHQQHLMAMHEQQRQQEAAEAEAHRQQQEQEEMAHAHAQAQAQAHAVAAQAHAQAQQAAAQAAAQAQAGGQAPEGGH